jgi:putative peptidoglycan lipid II flippase
MNERERVTRAAGVVGGATLVSRVLGFVREMVISYFFGASVAADAFFVAFRIPNLIRRLFAEGTLTISFIPVFTRVLTEQGPGQAKRLSDGAFVLLTVTLLVFLAAGEIFTPTVVSLIAPGFAPSPVQIEAGRFLAELSRPFTPALLMGPDKFELTVWLTRITLPYLVFICLVALGMGVLNSTGHFFAPAAAPILLNLAIIVCALALTPLFDPPVTALAVGVILGGVAQLMLQWPFLVKKGFAPRPTWRMWHPAMGRVLRLFVPAVVGAAVYQLNVFVSTLLASPYPGSVSYLWYADRVVQFPLGVFGVAVGTAVLPSLSRLAAADQLGELRDTMNHALRLTMFITLPSIVGLLVLARPVVELFFLRGKFTPVDALATSQTVIAYLVGLWAVASVAIVVRVFYAYNDAKTPVAIAVAALLLNILLALSLVETWRHVGLALATSLASILNFGLLIIFVRRKIGRIGGRRLAISVLKSAAASAVMGLGVWLAVRVLVPGGPSTWGRLWTCGLGTVLGGVFFVMAAAALRCPELAEIRGQIRRRTGAGPGGRA